MNPDEMSEYMAPLNLDEVKALFAELPEDSDNPLVVRLRLILAQHRVDRNGVVKYWRRVQMNNKLMRQLWQIATKTNVRPITNYPSLAPYIKHFYNK